jgi:hypothetical protein
MISIPEENVVVVRLGEKRSKSIQLDGKKVSEEELKKVGHSSDFLKYINFAEQIRKEAASK